MLFFLEWIVPVLVFFKTDTQWRGGIHPTKERTDVVGFSVTGCSYETPFVMFLKCLLEYGLGLSKTVKCRLKSMSIHI